MLTVQQDGTERPLQIPRSHNEAGQEVWGLRRRTGRGRGRGVGGGRGLVVGDVSPHVARRGYLDPLVTECIGGTTAADEHGSRSSYLSGGMNSSNSRHTHTPPPKHVDQMETEVKLGVCECGVCLQCVYECVFLVPVSSPRETTTWAGL